MKTTNFKLTRYDADEGKVFDWAKPRFITHKDENGNDVEVQQHLYVKTLFIGNLDKIENYIEIDNPEEEV
jgi:hypothetical protein